MPPAFRYVPLPPPDSCRIKPITRLCHITALGT